MLRTATRKSALLVAILGALLSLAFAGTAFAASGDSQGNAALLTPGSTLTTQLAGTTNAGPDTSFYLRVELDAGNVFSADFTHSPHVLNVKPLLYPIASRFDFLGWMPSSSTLTRMSFVAPIHGMYQIELTTSGTDDSSVGTFTVAPTVVTAAKFGWASAPSSAKHGKSFGLSVTSTPPYNALDKPTTKFYFDRYVGGKTKYKAYASFTAKLVRTTDTYSQFTGSAKITKTGTYRVRMKLTDAAHPSGVWVTGFKTIKIK